MNKTIKTNMVTVTTDAIDVYCPQAPDLEFLAQALAEGEHELGPAATAVGNALVQWPGNDCPWAAWWTSARSSARPAASRSPS